MASVEYLDIEPVSLATVKRTLKNKKVLIGDDVLGVAAGMREVDDRFRLHYDPYEGVYVVSLHIVNPDGSTGEHFVGAYPELDMRIVRRCAEVAAPGYDFLAEAEKREREAEHAAEHERRERMGDASERLEFAFKKDLARDEVTNSLKSRAFIPKPFKPTD